MEQVSGFVFESEHFVKYTNGAAIPISEVIKSLAAFEKLIGQTPFVINALIGDDDIERVEIFISTLQSGSLLEKFLIRYYFKDEAGFDAWVQKLRVKTGMEDGKIFIPTLIGGSIAAVTLAGIFWAAQPNQNIESTSSITGNNNVVIQYVAQNLNMSADEVARTVAGAISDKKMVASNAVKAIHPAKLDPEASIEIDGDDQLEITASTVKEAPSAYEPPQPDTRTDSYKRALIQIRAVDLDKPEGWRVVVPGISEKRLPLEIKDDIDVVALMKSGGVIQADIDVIKRYDGRRKDYAPSSVFLKNWESTTK